MKRINIFLTLLTGLVIFSFSRMDAQEGHYYTVVTWKIEVPDDGSYSELNEILKEFTQKVVLNNEKVISQKILHHVYGDDLRDLVIISEYADWNAIDEASKKQDELSKEAWPDEDNRKSFYKKWRKYVITHSDEIYQEYPDLTKSP